MWQLVGRTPWSARDALVPLFARSIKRLRHPGRPTGASAADQGVRPTIHCLRRSSQIKPASSPQVVGSGTPESDASSSGIRSGAVPVNSKPKRHLRAAQQEPGVLFYRRNSSNS